MFTEENSFFYQACAVYKIKQVARGPGSYKERAVAAGAVVAVAVAIAVAVRDLGVDLGEDRQSIQIIGLPCGRT